IIPWVSLIGLFYWAAELFFAWYGQNDYEWYVFNEGDASNSRGLYSAYWWILLIARLVIPLLFFIRFLRTNRIFIVFYIVLFNYERVVIYITSLYRDYLPSSWSTYYDEQWNTIVIGWIFCALV